MSNQFAITDSDLDAITLSGRMLGGLFYYEPDDASMADVYSLLQDEQWVDEWPCGDKSELMLIAEQLKEGLLESQSETLAQAYQRLFVGPNSLVAPPWGSVYLDHECVIFGESTIELRQWQSSLGIATQTEVREPEDHIGLLLMLAAWLAEHHPEQIQTLLADHLLPWSGRYLELLETEAEHPFYSGLAKLTKITLADWQTRLSIDVKSKRIYF